MIYALCVLLVLLASAHFIRHERQVSACGVDYIVCWTEVDKEGYARDHDSYVRVTGLKDAQELYALVQARDNTYSLNLAKLVQTTD